MDRLTIVLLVVMVGLAVVISAVPAGAMAWDSFTYATLSGVYVSPAVATGVLSYDISMDPGATMSFGGATYQINWISAFYLRSQDKDTYFTAEDSGLVSDWTWDAKPKGSRQDVAGWKGQGNAERIFAGEWKNLQFGSLDITGVNVDLGFHFGYGSQDDSGFFYGDVPITQHAPEPSTLQAASLLLAGAGGLAIRRQRKR